MNPRENAISIRGDIKAKGHIKSAGAVSSVKPPAPTSGLVKKKLTLQEQMMAAAAEAAASPSISQSSDPLATPSMGVSIRGIVPQKKKVDDVPKVQLDISPSNVQSSTAPAITVLAEEWAGLD